MTGDVTLGALRRFNVTGLPPIKYTTAAPTASGTFAAGQLTGADITVFTSTTSTPGTLTSRTAAQMYADTPSAFPNQKYLLRVFHTGSGTLTVGAGSNVTITGTATISTATWRDFMVTFNTASTATLQNIGSGTA